jgi:hypothetical protein
VVPLEATHSPQGQEDLPGQADSSPSGILTKTHVGFAGNGVHTVIFRERVCISHMRIPETEKGPEIALGTGGYSTRGDLPSEEPYRSPQG